jgi:nicotinamidase-related amidase
VTTTVSGLPARLRPRFASAALITVDLQRDVLDAGPLGVPGTAEAVASASRLADAFRRAERPVVHVVRLYLPGGANADLCRRDVVASAAEPILRPGTSGAELADGLWPAAGRAAIEEEAQPGIAARGASPEPGRIMRLDADLLLAGGIQPVGPREDVVYKPRWGAFYSTPLHRHLRGLGVDTLVFCGANFPNCPRTSVYEASERDYRLVLAVDATSGLYPRGVRELEGIGVVPMSTAAIVDRLDATVGASPAAS